MIDLHNGLLFVLRQAINWTNDVLPSQNDFWQTFSQVSDTSTQEIWNIYITISIQINTL